jgi:hypothetical protein
MAEARNVIENAAYDAATVAVLGQAFDEAWLSLDTTYDPNNKEAGRTKLAQVILTLASAGHRELTSLKKLASKAMLLGK